jgi:hypothetical protein
MQMPIGEQFVAPKTDDQDNITVALHLQGGRGSAWVISVATVR